MNLPPLHPALVHLPIAFVLLSVLADFFARITGNNSLRAAGFWSLIAALIGGVITIAAGYLDVNKAALSGETQEYVDLHLKIGWSLAVCLILLTFWRWRIWRINPPTMNAGYLVAGFLVLALTLFQGWFGGEMVFSHGAGVAAAGQGTEAAPRAQKRLAKVKGFLAPNESHMGAPSKGVGEQRGNDEKSQR